MTDNIEDKMKKENDIETTLAKMSDPTYIVESGEKNNEVLGTTKDYEMAEEMLEIAKTAFPHSYISTPLKTVNGHAITKLEKKPETYIDGKTNKK